MEIEYREFLYNKKNISIELQKEICEQYIKNNFNLKKTYLELNIGEKLARKIVEINQIKKKPKKLCDYYDFIIKNQDLSASELSEIINFSSSKIQIVLNAIKLQLTQETENNIIIDKKYNKLNNAELSSKYGISDRVLGHYFKIHNMLKSSIRKPKIQKNTFFFKEIDNYEKAYWLGFIYADGSIDKHSLSIGISRKDKDVLFKFCKSLNMDITHIKDYIDNHFGKEMCSILITDSVMIEDINKIYIGKNKTYNMHIPNIDKHLFKYFLCGYFDGDGFVSSEKSKPTIEFTCHKNNILWLTHLQNYLSEHNIESHIDLRERKNCIRLRIWKTSSFYNFRNLIYDDSGIKNLCMKRKMDRFFNR